MNRKIKVLGILFGLSLLPLTSVRAQFCNPAVVDYIVRDGKGTVVGGEELKTIHQQLPETIGNAGTAVSEVSFTGDGVTYYWRDSVDWDKGKKVSALEFANAATCTLEFPRVDLAYQGMKMTLIFDINIARKQDDRRVVIDSLPFQNGVFTLDLTGWSHSRDQMIPATRWKKGKG
ncbi:MAG: hypothetical protein DMF69_11280 [Acidobacteria bacterium]|nr:MAG: hypothetical protein DMF69_11280 [Acidobacteriota bacterium]